MPSIKKWGNSAAVRIPAAVLSSAGMALEAAVDIREEQGRIVIEGQRKRFRISDLVDAINQHNLHDAIGTGRPMGNEAW